MSVFTRITLSQGIYGCYIQENVYDIIKSITSLAPAEWKIEEDTIDFIMKPEDVRYNTLVRPTDTLIISTDAKGTFSTSSIYRKIGKIFRFPLEIDFAVDLRCIITKSWEAQTELHLYEDSNPSDIVLRTNRRTVACIVYGNDIKIAFEKHWRGPYLLDTDSSWLFKRDPVCFCEIEIEGDASHQLCKNIITCLLPGSKTTT